MEISQNLRQAIMSYRAGDANAFTPIYEESQKYVYTCVYKVMNGNDNAYDATMDIMSETFFEISQSLYNLNDIEKYYSWAGTIATRKCYDYIKKNKKYVLMPEEEEGFDDIADDNIIPESIYQDKEKQRLLREIIDNNLSEIQKICVIGYFYNEQKIQEIAAELNLPEGTIKTNLFRAKGKIKEGVLSLEKNQGTRLYSASPLLAVLFAEEVITNMVPYQLSYQVLSNVFSAMSVGAMAGGTVAARATGVAGVNVMAADMAGNMSGAAGVGNMAANMSAGTPVGGMAASMPGGMPVGGMAANMPGGMPVGDMAANMPGELPVGNMADNIAGNATAGSITGEMAKVGAAEGAKAAGIGAAKGIAAKLAAMSLKAKLVGGAIALATAGAIGGIVFTATHDDKPKDKETVTEIVTTEAITTEAMVTEATTEVTTEATTEAPVEEVTVSEEEVIALTTLALNLTATEWGVELNGVSLEIDDAIVWEFVGRMNNNAQYDGVETQYMPVSTGVDVYSQEAMTQYAYDVFGLDTLEYTSNYWFTDKGDGTYSLYPAQMGDTDKCVIKSIHIDGDTYTVTGVNSWGEYTDINQTEPTYSANRTYEFTMVVTKNSDSPFGFRLVSMSYVYGDVSDLGITEPPVVTVADASSGDNGESGIAPENTLTEAEYEEQRKDDVYTCTTMNTASSACLNDKAIYDYVYSGSYMLVEVTPGTASVEGIKVIGADANYVHSDGRTAVELEALYKSEFLRIMGDDVPALCYIGGSSIVPGPIEAYYIYYSSDGSKTIYLGPSGLTVDQITAEQTGDNIYAIMPTVASDYKTWE